MHRLLPIYFCFVKRERERERVFMLSLSAETNADVTGAFNSASRYFQASILYKSIAGRYRPVSYPDGPITARYRFIKNASWVDVLLNMIIHILKKKVIKFI